MTIDGKPFTQETQKYHAKSLAALRARYAAVADHATLDPILDRAGVPPLAGGLSVTRQCAGAAPQTSASRLSRPQV